MKLFQSVQKYLLVLGIDKTQFIDVPQLNVKSVTILVIMILCSVMNCTMFFKPHNLVEYVETFYSNIMILVIIIDFVMLVWKSSILFTFIRNFEAFIKNSELHFEYTDYLEWRYYKIEHYSRAKTFSIKSNIPTIK